tara:strand:+ start:200 stop:463 length:264 start_codon:yes stop_codon:yes gene_type:complete
MNQISECCDAPLVYHIWEKLDESIGYEPWDFCPQCLKCCSGYDPEERDAKNKMNELLKGANNETIRKSLKRLSKECGFGRKNNAVNS